MTINNENAQALVSLLRTFIEESKQDRVGLRKEIKELAHDTDRKIETLNSQISNLALDTRNEIERVGAALSGQLLELRKEQKTDPKFWTSAISVVATFAIMATGLIAFALQSSTAPINTGLNALKDSVVEHKDLDGHAGALSKHARHSVNIEDIRKEIELLRKDQDSKTRDRWTKKDHERWVDELNKRLERLEQEHQHNR